MRQLAIVAELFGSLIGHLVHLLVCWVLGEEPSNWLEPEPLR